MLAGGWAMLLTILMLAVLVLSFLLMLWLVDFAEHVIERPRREAVRDSVAALDSDKRLATTSR
jgi:hypothetical protein